MYKGILIAVAVFSFSQLAQADQDKIWDCVDSTTLKSDQSCVAKNFEVNAFNTEFFNELAYKDFVQDRGAFASIILAKDKKSITIKPLHIEDKRVFFARK